MKRHIGNDDVMLITREAVKGLAGKDINEPKIRRRLNRIMECPVKISVDNFTFWVDPDYIAYSKGGGDCHYIFARKSFIRRELEDFNKALEKLADEEVQKRDQYIAIIHQFRALIEEAEKKEVGHYLDKAYEKLFDKSLLKISGDFFNGVGKDA
ncbi:MULTISPECIES: hypothetical protein [Oscillospiraceae]|uniref:Uncharacterized protein n=1 Tax=Pseudobacteroides cellulosolvens ATCC 35603 = DSM 2933 TaxID=398512 RepID=A0A0L6JTB3_9FIRM|nr:MULTISPECIES: hypothetical protein [Oscillospiraceae]KNY29058.1 hypothetical protein Bccel_4332 [Pseudobacteroides cellulosolvens ATCC 35603 = DSM 2933]